MIHVGGLDNLLYTPNGNLHRLLTKLAFKNLLHPFQPFIIGQRLIGPSIASKFGINLVMYGENQAEYGNNVEENKTPKMKNEYFSIQIRFNLFKWTYCKRNNDKYKFSLNDFVCMPY